MPSTNAARGSGIMNLQQCSGICRGSSVEDAIGMTTEELQSLIVYGHSHNDIYKNSYNDSICSSSRGRLAPGKYPGIRDILRQASQGEAE